MSKVEKIFEAEKIFEEDEHFPEVNPDWSREELLQQEGLFFLKDVGALLGVSNQIIKGRVKALLEEGKSPYRCIGVKKLWGHWVVRMTVFAPYYPQLQPRYQPVLRNWDGNDLLRQKGLFRLADVCQKIPFTGAQLRAKYRSGGAKGIYRDKDTGIYTVEMEPFAAWISEVWQSEDETQ